MIPIRSLTPKDEKHGSFRARAIDLSASLFEARLFLRQQVGRSLQVPFLVLLIFSLTIIFTSIGLFTPPQCHCYNLPATLLHGAFRCDRIDYGIG